MFNLKDIISSIADAGKKLFKKSTAVKKNDVETIITLCDDLLSNKGAAFGITVARDVTDLYQTLSHENKLLFFKKINEKYKPSHSKVEAAIDIYKKKQDDKNLFELFRIAEGQRRELFTRMNMAPYGTPVILSIREDLISFLKDNQELIPLDNDLRHLFKSWFLAGQNSLPKKIICKCSLFHKSFGHIFFKSRSVISTFFPFVSPHLFPSLWMCVSIGKAG